MTEVAAAGTHAPDQEADRSELGWRLAPVGVALGSLVLGIVAAGRRSLSTDEAVAFAQAREPIGDVLSTIVHHEPGQAAELLVLKLATLFGNDELALRAPSAIAVALAAGLLVVLGTMLVGRAGGLVAGIALAANAGVFEASREARPYALGILGIVVATLLFTLALERGGGWRWIPYAIAAAALPLVHPASASVLAAHGAALIVMRDRPDLKRAVAALAGGTVAAGLLLAATVVDRLEAPDGAGTLDLERLGRSLAYAVGWNPLLVAAGAAGLFALFSLRTGADGRRRGVLVASLVAAPVAATLLANVVLPVYTGPLVLAAPGIALASGAIAPLVSQAREHFWAGVGVFLVASAITIAAQLSAPTKEDWRALTAAVKGVRAQNEFAVVIPERSLPAFTYYARYVPVLRRAHGAGAWLAVVASTPGEAIDRARPAVTTPRYALLRQFRYGSELRLQHWVRP